MTPEERRRHEENREHAAAIMLDHARDVERMSIREHLEEHGVDQHDAIRVDTIADLIATADITIEWPGSVTVPAHPRIVCLCGSTRFRDAFDAVNRAETLAGAIVLAPGSYSHTDGHPVTDAQKAALDTLHLRKIDLADEVLVLNVGGYVGESTRSEIAYAERTGVPVRYLVAPGGESA